MIVTHATSVRRTGLAPTQASCPNGLPYGCHDVVEKDRMYLVRVCTFVRDSDHLHEHSVCEFLRLGNKTKAHNNNIIMCMYVCVRVRACVRVHVLWYCM